MIDIKHKQSCCGCSACVNICPKKCIELEPDEEGFLYPVVNKSACINCDLCVKVCPVLNTEEPHKPLKVFAALNKDKTTRVKSSSGGIFSIVASDVIDKGGIVYGAKFDENWNVIIDSVETHEDLDSLRRSKYVQARINKCFKKVKENLEKGRLVLYTGTPCQIAGLRLYLRREYDNLILMDLICEGVPSPKVWKDYLQEEIIRQLKLKGIIIDEKTLGSVTINNISFRDKSASWGNYSFLLEFTYKEDHSNSIKTIKYIDCESSYLKASKHKLFLRPICYECPFKCGKSHSDITIGDYWGITQLYPNIYDNLGTSMVLVNTMKGDSCLDLSRMKYVETDYQSSLKFNNIETSVKMHPNRKKFFKELSSGNNVIESLQNNILTTEDKIRRIIRMSAALILPKNIYEYSYRVWQIIKR